MLMIWSARCTFLTETKMELEFLSGLGLISSRGSQGSRSPRGQSLAVLLGFRCLVGVVCRVLGGRGERVAFKPLWGPKVEGHEGVAGTECEAGV